MSGFEPAGPLRRTENSVVTLRHGKPEATEEEVTAAAKAAYAHDFIMEQPGGYRTMVGKRGVRFSGGQRQRIAIARALLKDALSWCSTKRLRRSIRNPSKRRSKRSAG